jgi:hypothetical protein
MAVTIGLGASIFTIWDTVTGTRLPLDEGHRVVALQPFDKAAQRVLRETPLPDFRRWRETLKSVEHLSAMRTFIPTVIVRDNAEDSVAAAEMTASGFRVARVQPLLGRPLIEDDEREGAEPVAVIGYQLWQEGFSSDPAVLGQRIQIGDTPHIVVGVMPQGFGFPVSQRLWTPLRSSPAGERADAFIFARLAPGATLEGAQAEVATFGLLPREPAPGTTAPLEPRVVPYTVGFRPGVVNPWLGGLVFLLAALLLIPPCANIAILVYARTVTRRDEFAARTALGASRGRIVMQLFVEVLVLAAGAGIAGLFLAREFSGRLAGIVMPALGPVPFWMDYQPSVATVLAGVGLSVLAAAIAGAVPAVRVTGGWSTGTPWRRSLWSTGTPLRRSLGSAGTPGRRFLWRRAGGVALGNRRAGARLGKTWMALLATQVALSLAILPSAMEMLWGVFRPTIVGPGMPMEEYLTASLVMEGDTSRFETLRSEAVRQLTSEAGTSETGTVGVTVSAFALFAEPQTGIEVEGGEAEDSEARFNSVDGKFFAVYGARFLAGRSFDANDFGPGRYPVIVNRSFVTEVLGEGNPLGRRLRYRETEQTQEAARGAPLAAAPRQAAWHEITGVVEDLTGSNDGPQMFHPMTGTTHPVSVTIRVQGAASSRSGLGPVTSRLREVVSGLDSQLRVGQLASLDQMYWERRSLEHMFGFLLGTVTLIVLLFSMAGIYTLMAFIVAQRWREIGVRAALGAQPRRLLLGIFGRAAVPLLIGAIAGSALALRLQSFLPIAEAGGRSIPGIVPVSVAVMLVVGLLAVAGPARRAIRIDPTEALRVS